MKINYIAFFVLPLFVGCAGIGIKKPTLEAPHPYQGVNFFAWQNSLKSYFLHETDGRFRENVSIRVDFSENFGDLADDITQHILSQGFTLTKTKVLSKHFPEHLQYFYDKDESIFLELNIFQESISKVVLVIDDLGHNKKALSDLLQIDRPMTMAVLPHLTYSKYLANKVKEKGYEVIVHLPMQPQNENVNPGPGAIYIDMNKSEIINLIEDAIQSVPHAVGMNNHMGSLATTDKEVMQTVLMALKSVGMFFLDSKTARSVSSEVAKDLNLTVRERDVFLDNVDETSYIEDQLRILIKQANKLGVAIGIGHFRINTMIAIKEMLEEFDEAGIEFVYLSNLYQREIKKGS